MKYLSLCVLLLAQLLISNSVYAVKSDEALRARAIDSSRTLESRMRALKKLYKHMLVNGEMPDRRICIWDVLGRQGPVYASTVDIQLRFKLYGINMDLVAYKNEDEAIKDLTSGKCDSAVISGAKANQFNRFTGSIEALGGLTSKDQMEVLLQVLTSPQVMKKMQNDEYVIIGVLPFGENYLFNGNRNESDLESIMKGKASTVSDDVSQNALFNNFNTLPVKHSVMAEAASRFNKGNANVMLAPKVAYNMFGLDTGLRNGAIIDYPVSQMTLQIVGRIESIPPEIALILREDLYIKFNYLYRVVDRMSRVPNSLLKSLSPADEALISENIKLIRQEQKELGNYDKSMLKLQDKIRCKLDASLPVCQS